MYPLRRIYTLSFFLALSIALTAYVNSTFLAGVFSEKIVGLFFSGAALLTIICLEYIPKVLKRFGARKTTKSILVLSTISLLALSLVESKTVTGIAFMLYILCNNLAVFCFDIFIEHYTKIENTGRSRGTYLTITNIGWLISPFASGVLITALGHRSLYALVSGVVIIVLVLFSKLMRDYVDTTYHNRSPLKALSYIHHHPNILRIIFIAFILQLFFSWMIIFTPVYLNQVVGLPFATIGSIFTVMLLPFVILTLPLGRLADKHFGEKKLLALGLIIMSVATLLFASYGGKAPFIFAILLFFTRVGAATVEIMYETYFFKSVGDQDPDIISLFRATTPLAFIIGPLLGTLLLNISSHTVLFYILSIIIIFGLFPARKLLDIK